MSIPDNVLHLATGVRAGLGVPSAEMEGSKGTDVKPQFTNCPLSANGA